MNGKNILWIVIALVAAGYWAYNNFNANFEEDEPKGIQFHRGSWEEALHMAKKENKLIFLNIYATWCGPCKKMKNTTFSDPEVGEMFNSNFINVSLDGEKSEGAQLARHYQVNAYPTLLFINVEGKVIGATRGLHSSTELMHFIKEVGINPLRH